MTDTTILSNGRILTMDASNTQCEALAFTSGEVVAAGASTDLRERFPHAELVDAHGAWVVPGFVDAHHHVSVSALYNDQVDIGPLVAQDIPSLQQALARAAADAPSGRWLVATGWDEHQLRERRPPTLAEIDEAVPDHPLFALHYTCHRALANSRALKLAGISSSTADPSGGEILRTSKRPNGVLVERAMSPVEALARASLLAHDREGLLARMAAHYDVLLGLGITAVADTTVPVDLIDVYRESARRGQVRVPTIICPVSSLGYLEEPWEVIESELGPSGTADEGMLTIGPVKLVFDGAPQCSMCMSWWSAAGVTLRTLALAARRSSLDPIRASMSIAPRLGLQVRSGIAIYRPEEAKRVVAALVDRGFAVATHAIGNAAVDVALTAYEHVGHRVHEAAPARLEHAAFLDDALVSRIADVGAVVVAQPDFIRLPTYADVPDIPGLHYTPLRALIDAGVLVAGSSDYPVASYDPLDGIRSAIRRQSARGDVRAPGQCISVHEAFRLYTTAAAEACGILNDCGSLEVGKRADFVVLDGEMETLDGLRVRQTWLGGEKVVG